MKSLIRWSATLGLVGSTVLGSWFGPTLALPKQEILQKLGPVPVFTIADPQGAPLVASGEDDSKVAGVFISQSDAESFVEKLKGENPTLANQVRVVTVSLGEVYELAQEIESKGNDLVFQFVPMQQQVQSAETLLRQNNPEFKEFKGVPLFFATVTKDNQEGYLYYQQETENGTQKKIPLFFEKEPLLQMVEKFKSQQPDMASQVETKIKVASLEVIIAAFQNKDAEDLSQMVLVPSRESSEIVKKALQQQRQQGQ